MLIGHVHPIGDVVKEFKVVLAQLFKLGKSPEEGFVIDDEADAILFEFLGRVQVGEDQKTHGVMNVQHPGHERSTVVSEWIDLIFVGSDEKGIDNFDNLGGEAQSTGVQIVKQLTKHIRFNIIDECGPSWGFGHVACKHGSQDGTAHLKEVNMSRYFLAFDDELNGRIDSLM